MGQSTSYPKKARCGGRACSSCGECRDWYILRDWHRRERGTTSHTYAGPKERTWQRHGDGTCGDGHPNEPNCRRHHFPDARYTAYEARGLCMCSRSRI